MRFILVFVLFIFTPHFGLSNSEVGQSDVAYENWESTATRAESVLLAGRASEKSLEILRDEIRNWRSVFKTSIGINSCLLYTSPSPRDRQKSRMPSSA